MTQILKIVYCSHACWRMTDYELKELLRESQDFNARNAITGMLVHCNGLFVQALEGEPAIVQSLYEDIMDDPRHHRVHTMGYELETKRDFKDWSMGFENLATSVALADRNALHGRGYLSFEASKLLLRGCQPEQPSAERLVKTFFQLAG